MKVYPGKDARTGCVQFLMHGKYVVSISTIFTPGNIRVFKSTGKGYNFDPRNDDVTKKVTGWDNWSPCLDSLLKVCAAVDRFVAKEDSSQEAS